MARLNISPAELRDDWTDDPNIDDYQLHALQTAGDGEVENALQAALERREQRLWEMVDEIRNEATQTLLDRRATT